MATRVQVPQESISGIIAHGIGLGKGGIRDCFPCRERWAKADRQRRKSHTTSLIRIAVINPADAPRASRFSFIRPASASGDCMCPSDLPDVRSSRAVLTLEGSFACRLAVSLCHLNAMLTVQLKSDSDERMAAGVRSDAKLQRLQFYRKAIESYFTTGSAKMSGKTAIQIFEYQ